jgi:exodeoxyribonuclease VII large subunit
MSALARFNQDVGNEIKVLQQHSKYFIHQQRVKHIHQNLILIEKGSRRMLILKIPVIDATAVNILNRARTFIRREDQVIAGIEKNIELLNPVNIFNRGYSITLVNGNVLKMVENLREGTILTTILADGNITSIAQSVNKTEKHEEGA